MRMLMIAAAVMVSAPAFAADYQDSAWLSQPTGRHWRQVSEESGPPVRHRTAYADDGYARSGRRFREPRSGFDYAEQGRATGTSGYGGEYEIARLDRNPAPVDDRFPADPSCRFGASFHYGRDGTRYACR